MMNRNHHMHRLSAGRRLCAGLLTMLAVTATSVVQAQPVEAGAGSAALVPVTVDAAQSGSAQLTLSWRHSWRDAPGSPRGNHDGVWLFAKHQDSAGRWQPLRIAQAAAGEGYALERPQDGLGVFLFRARAGAGDVRATVSLQWEPAGAQRIRVHAWPVVHVPEGPFQLGDGAASTPGRFHAGDDPARPYTVTAAPIELAPRAGALWADASRTPLPAGAPGPSPWDGTTATLPAAFPTGYRAFWIQRYEVTQGQYADFLDTLSPEQAAARAPDSADFRGSGRPLPDNYRYTLAVQDGRWRAAQPGWSMNWLSWSDGAALADWAGLRPMTELEFEKAARGRAPAVPGEYAWGTTRIVAIRGFDGVDGSGSERALPADANTSWSPGTQDRPLLGPYGAGLLADRATREGRGESYWGVADLSGNLVEMAVSVGVSSGRSFVPRHGDGRINDAGEADVAEWPRIQTRARPFGDFGFGYRGGDFYNPERDLRTSSRNVATFGGTRRLFGLGFRAVRGASPLPDQ